MINANLNEASVATPRPTSLHRAVIITLMAAGEGMFLLPFVLARIFRPTLLDVFGLTNLQLGAAFSVYGVFALASYFPGGASGGSLRGPATDVSATALFRVEP